MQSTKFFDIVTIQALEIQIKKIFASANVNTNVTNASFNKISKTRATDTNQHMIKKDYECLKQNVESINRNVYTKY